MKLLHMLVLMFLMACSATPESFDLIISNVDLIDGTGSPLQENVAVYVKDGRISMIRQQMSGSARQVIDGSGKYLIPGLFDCHTHPNPVEESFPKFIHFGVTSILVTGCSDCNNKYYTHMRRQGNSDKHLAPRVFHTSQHFSMEGRHPVKTYPSDKWRDGETIYLLNDTSQIAANIAEVAAQPVSGIKVTIEEGPNPPFVERMPEEFVSKIVSEAGKHGLEVFAHVSDNIELGIAQRSGVQNLVHFTGVDIDWDRDKSMIQALADRRVSWVTTLMIDKGFLYPLNPKWLKVPALADVYPLEELSQMVTVERVEEARRLMLLFYRQENPAIDNVINPQTEDIKRLSETGINIVLGTDTGNRFIFPGYSMHEEMQLMEIGGFKPLEIIRMATFNAAKMLKATDSLGTIETGKIADFVLLDKNPLDAIQNTLAINAVIKRGQIQPRIIND